MEIICQQDERKINKRSETKFEILYVHKNDYLISFTKNISADGMFVETEKPPAVGSTIKLIFSIDNFKKMEIDAEIIWINKGASSKDIKSSRFRVIYLIT
jgi:Tfp pilus assembly protein PilZ